MVTEIQTPETGAPDFLAYCEPVDGSYDFLNEDYFLRQTNPEAYLGAVGVLATVMDLPGEAKDYQEQFEQRDISAASFLAIMAREAVSQQIERHPRVAGFISRIFSAKGGVHAQPGYTARHA